MYRNGLGVPKDTERADSLEKQANILLKHAAEGGDAFAQFNLGLMYANGQGVPQDYKTAFKWYSRAAEQGDSPAQASLGAMYYKGQGKIQDYIRAHMWLNISASQGEKLAGKLRDIVEKKMSPTNISTALKLIRECVQKNYKGC